METSNIKANTKAGKNIKYSFTVYNGSQELYLNLIGFDHEQKRIDLTFNIERKKNNKYCRSVDVEQKILNILKEENVTAKQISRKLIMSHVHVLNYIKRLHKLGKIEVVRKERWANVWKSSD